MEGISAINSMCAAKVVTTQTTHDAAAAAASSSNATQKKLAHEKVSATKRPSKYHAARTKISQRKALVDSIHKTLFNKDCKLDEMNAPYLKVGEKIEGRDKCRTLKLKANREMKADTKIWEHVKTMTTKNG